MSPFSIVPDTVLKLHFYELSTQSAHRGAQEAVITVPMTAVPWTHFEVDICGSKVSLLMNSFQPHRLQPSARLLVYDWKNGRLQMNIAKHNSHHSTAVFLSTKIILLVISENNWGVLELWSIQDLLEYGPEIVLELPKLPNHHEYEIRRVESYPKGNDNTRTSQSESLHSSFVDSLVVLDVGHFHEMIVQDMFLMVPRHALLQQITSAQSCGEKCSWTEWGPSICQWVPGSGFDQGWATVACAQRCVFLTEDRSIILLDFNPYTWKRALLKQTKPNDLSAAPTTGQFVLSELDFVDELALFGEQTHSRLQYVAKKSREATTWSGVMMDEEWIVGVNDRLDTDGRFSLDVWHFG
ncbi:hypothetical protein K438DRAFT_896385 [Mycena galopus ATCC 62051]|nr:hypothetical protein K438DRAFT_896385 [Mycena galopus ATCC 62051]